MIVVLGAAFLLTQYAYTRNRELMLLQQLETDAHLLREALTVRWSVIDDRELQAMVKPLRDLDVEVVLIAIDGRVLFDTLADPVFTKDLFVQPEVREAFETGWSARLRQLPGHDREFQSLAIRAGNDDSIQGILWLARPLDSVVAGNFILRNLWLFYFALVVIGGVLLTAAVESLRVRFCRRVIDVARGLSGEETSSHEPIVVESEEYAMIAGALRRVREKLADQLTTIDRQRLTLKTLIDQLHEGVIVADEEGRIALLNPAAIRLLNLSAHEGDTFIRMIGKPVERCIPQLEIQKMLAGNGSDADSRLQIDTPEGAVHLLAQHSPVLLPGVGEGENGSTHGRMLVLTDITELTRVIRVKTDFVANASHELRTPLSAIKAAIETISQMDLMHEADAARRFFDTIRRQSARLEALVSDLLDLSRLESQAARFEPASLDPLFEMAELQARFERQIQEKALIWRMESHDGVPTTIAAHPHLLHLILDNLVDNAIKFTEEGGTISVSCASVPEGVAFTIADTGCGIPEQDRQRVFERFYQVERARSGEKRGTGLGLSIVRHAVAAMQGSVKLESKLGEGTRVTVSIPQPHERAAEKVIRD